MLIFTLFFISFLYFCYFCILLLIINCTIFFRKMCSRLLIVIYLFINVATSCHFVYLVSILFSYHVYSVYLACIPCLRCVSVCCIELNFPVVLIVLWLLIVKKKCMSFCTLFYGIVAKCCKISLPCLREFTAQSCG